MTHFFAKLNSPNDWPENWQELRIIDNLLRCSICSEYLDNATIIPNCSHTYCSVCIRRYLNYSSECPTCNLTLQESDLRNNRIIDEIIKNFIKLREQLLKVIKENDSNPGQIEPAKKSDGSETDNKKTSRFLHSVSPKSSQKRQRREKSSTSDHSSSSDEFVPVGKKRLLQSNTLPDRVNESSDEDEISLVGNVEVQNTKPEVSKDSVECPVCGRNIPSFKINYHLDSCLKGEDKNDCQPSTSQQSQTVHLSHKNTNKQLSPVGANSFIPQVTNRKPLNKLVYSLMSEKQLKKTLKECGLSTKGDRQTLIKRHQEYTVIYNSECNKPQQKSTMAIARLVEDGEKKRRKKSELGKLNFDRSHSQEDIDRMKDEYVSDNQREFMRLQDEILLRKKKRTADSENSDVHNGQRGRIKNKRPPEERHIMLVESDNDSSEMVCPVPERSGQKVVTKKCPVKDSMDTSSLQLKEHVSSDDDASETMSTIILDPQD